MKPLFRRTVNCAVLFLTLALVPVSTLAASRIEGRVEGAGKPIAGADVTLWLAGPDSPKKLAETKTKDAISTCGMATRRSSPATASRSTSGWTARS